MIPLSDPLAVADKVDLIVPLATNAAPVVDAVNAAADPGFVVGQLGLVMDLLTGLAISIAKFAYAVYDFVNIFN